jgi:GT2 family glycosyltransferase
LSLSVAVVILNFNGKKYLEQFLPSVIASTYSNLQIIVADNGSSDDSITMVREKFSQIQLISLKENSGFAGGYNKALQQVNADVFVLLNSDVEVTPNWIEPIVELLEKNESVAAVQPKIRSFHNKEYFEYAGAGGGWIDSLGYPFARGRVFETVEKDEGQYDDVQNVFWATGAALFIRSDVWKRSGGLDESFFAHQEEIDLCWRIQLMGYKVAVCPSSVVYHVGGGTLPKGARKTFLNFRNNLIMLSKNMSAGEKLYKLPFRFLLDWVFALKALLSGDVGSSGAVFKAHWAFLNRDIKPSSANRPELTQLSGVFQGSLIVEYFLGRKKHFREIVKNSHS